MKRIFLAVVVLLSVTAISAAAQVRHVKAKLDGLHEVAVIINNATGTFTATINNDNALTYKLTYNNLSSPAAEVGIHIGAPTDVGATVIFLCTNLGDGPPDTPTCPDNATHSGTVTGTISAADVVDDSFQGVAAGDFADFVRAVASRVTYVEVKLNNPFTGWIRGQIGPGDE